MVTEVGEQAGGEDDGGASTEPALAPQPEQTILAEGASSREDQAQVEQQSLPGKLSIQVDQEEASEDIRYKEVTPEGKGYAFNKLIKSYKKSRNATKKINKIKNKIKIYKTKKEQNLKNKVVGHPDGEKRTFVPNMEGPDVLNAREMPEVCHLKIPDEEEDHLMLETLMGVLQIPAQEGWSQVSVEDSELEMDAWLVALSGGGDEDAGGDLGGTEDDGDINWMEMPNNNNTFEEWLVSELESMNFPLQNKLPSDEHSPTKSVGRGENDCDNILTAHTVQNVPLPNVRKAREGRGN